MIHECTQRKEREWWEGDKHIAVMAMTEVPKLKINVTFRNADQMCMCVGPVDH